MPASDYTKPTVRFAWAQNAGAADLVDPGNTYAGAGFLIGSKPPRQYANWIWNWASNGIRYLCQSGIPDWDTAETYGVGSIARGPDGLIYGSILANNVGQTPATSPTAWGSPQFFTPALADDSTSVATTAWVKDVAMPLTATFANIGGSIANGQVPQSAVTQYQGALSIAFSQLTGTIANGQVPQGAVTQYQGALSIAIGQITGSINAQTLTGLGVQPSGGVLGNAIVRTDANGYIYAPYFNQSSPNNENPTTVSQVMVTNGTDSFLRKASVAYFLSKSGALTGAQFGSSLGANGYQGFPSGFLMQYGECSPQDSQINVMFPIAFPNNCFGVVTNSTVFPTQSNVLATSKTGFTVYNSGGNSFWWAFGN